MDPIQAAIIYLACGTPFGVYLYLNRPESGNRVIYKAILVTLFWIVYLPVLSHRLVTDKLRRSTLPIDSASVPGAPLKVRHCSRAIEAFANRNGKGPGIYEIRSAVERFAGISELLHSAEEEGSDRFAGIASISGHPEPGLVVTILRRRNRAALESHRRRALKELLDIQKQLCTSDTREQQIDYAFSQLMKVCANGEPATLKAAEQNGNQAESARGNLRPRAVRPRWKTPEQPKPRQGLSVSLKRIALTSSLRNED